MKKKKPLICNLGEDQYFFNPRERKIITWGLVNIS